MLSLHYTHAQKTFHHDFHIKKFISPSFLGWEALDSKSGVRFVQVRALGNYKQDAPWPNKGSGTSHGAIK